MPTEGVALRWDQDGGLRVESQVPSMEPTVELLTEYWVEPGRAIGVYGHPDDDGPALIENGSDCVRAAYPLYCIAHHEEQPTVLTPWEVQHLHFIRYNGASIMRMRFSEVG